MVLEKIQEANDIKKLDQRRTEMHWQKRSGSF